MFDKTVPVEVTAKAKTTIYIDDDEAFRILCKTLGMDFIFDDDCDYYLKVFGEDREEYDPYYDQPCVCYMDEDGSERVADDRGNLFAALCTVAVNMYPNVEFRSAPYIYRYDPEKEV